MERGHQDIAPAPPVPVGAAALLQPSDSDSSDGVYVEVEVVEPWELERCKCPEGTPPLDNLVPGEQKLRCFECLRPYRGNMAIADGSAARAALAALQSTEQLGAASAAQPASSSGSAAQPAVLPSLHKLQKRETMFVKSFVYRRQGGKLQRLGKDMLCRYVDNVPPKGSKRGHNFELIQNFCKTAWENMQKHGIWATDCWVLDELEPHEFIALNYVNHSWVSDQVVARSSALQR